MADQIKFDSQQIFGLFNKSVSDLTSFLRPNKKIENDLRDLTLKLFELFKLNSGVPGIKDLVTEGFDEEQIWAQLEKHNHTFMKIIDKDVSNLSSLAKKLTKTVKIDIPQDDDFDILEPASSGEDEEEELKKLLGPREKYVGQMLSTFEQEQLQMDEKITKLEEENLKSKPWKLIGEVTADKRPANSLLEDHLQYDFVARPAPIIDEQVALKLEDLIKQRIKDGIWDDVERKIKPAEQPFEYKRRLILDQEKSKVGLAEVYEKDYLLRTQQEKVEEENETHKEIRKMMSAIFLQLDSLSSFHFTPKPPEPEVKIVNNLPAVSAEDTIPVAVSEANLLAPEEVLEKPKRPFKGATERDTTDRKHDRRLKKKKQKIIAARKNAKKISNVEKLSQSAKQKAKQAEKLEKTQKQRQLKPSQLKT